MGVIKILKELSSLQNSLISCISTPLSCKFIPMVIMMKISTCKNDFFASFKLYRTAQHTATENLVLANYFPLLGFALRKVKQSSQIWRSRVGKFLLHSFCIVSHQ